MRKIKHNAEVFLLVVAVVLIWRGIWGFADTYFLPDTPALSFGLSILIGIILLYLHDPKKKDIDEVL